MRILFVSTGEYFQEPLGVMLLSGVCKANGHQTKLVLLPSGPFEKKLKEFDPDVVAYSTMSSDEAYFIQADNLVKIYARERGEKIHRIMGGAHPTYFNEVLEKMDLDAICIGDGEHALARFIKHVEHSDAPGEIPNIIFRGQTKEECRKELVEDLDDLPMADRDIIYETRPDLLPIGLKSFLASRGCPYNCSYCFNHAFNRMFQGSGKIMRKRSVDNIIEEVKYVKKNYPPLKIIRFADDIFVLKKDDWLEQFAVKFRREVNIPFYCLVRPNNFTEDVAKALSEAGCISLGMAVESGNAEIRKSVLNRNLSDEVMCEAFARARKYKMGTYGGTILGLPGTNLGNDFESIYFSKKLKLTIPVFSIFSPYPKTDLTEYAIKMNCLDSSYNEIPSFGTKSILSNFTDEEKAIQKNLTLLGTLYCIIPWFSSNMLRKLSKINLTGVYTFFYSIVTSYLFQRRLVPGSLSNNPVWMMKAFIIFFKYWADSRKKPTTP
tara:strand:+ start:81 stop:1556 length:1476 start_codon:yes stop_codon:yes gene_type:complete